MSDKTPQLAKVRTFADDMKKAKQGDNAPKDDSVRTPTETNSSDTAQEATPHAADTPAPPPPPIPEKEPATDAAHEDATEAGTDTTTDTDTADAVGAANPPFHTLEKRKAKSSTPSELDTTAQQVSAHPESILDSKPQKHLEVGAEDVGEATIVTDTKQSKNGLFSDMFTELTNWASNFKNTYITPPKPSYRVSRSERRAGVLHDAVGNTGKAHVDHGSIEERIRNRYRESQTDATTDTEAHVDPAFLPELPAGEDTLAQATDATTAPRKSVQNKPVAPTAPAPESDETTPTSSRATASDTEVQLTPIPAPTAADKPATAPETDSAIHDRRDTAPEATGTTTDSVQEPDPTPIDTASSDETEAADTTDATTTAPPPTPATPPTADTMQADEDVSTTTDITPSSTPQPDPVPPTDTNRNETATEPTDTTAETAPPATASAPQAAATAETGPAEPAEPTPAASTPASAPAEPDTAASEAAPQTAQPVAEPTTPDQPPASEPVDDYDALDPEEQQRLEEQAQTNRLSFQIVSGVVGVALLAVVGYGIASFFMDSDAGVRTEHVIGDSATTIILTNYADSQNAAREALVAAAAETAGEITQVTPFTETAEGYREARTAELEQYLGIVTPDGVTANVRTTHLGLRNDVLFMYLDITDERQTFGSLLRWEQTMAPDLESLFGITSVDDFRDSEVAGYDARVGYRGSTPVLTYAVVAGHVIITTTPAVLERLISSRR